MNSFYVEHLIPNTKCNEPAVSIQMKHIKIMEPILTYIKQVLNVLSIQNKYLSQRIHLNLVSPSLPPPTCLSPSHLFTLLLPLFISSFCCLITVFSEGHFIMTSYLKKFMKNIPLPMLIPPPATKHGRVRRIQYSIPKPP